MSENPWHRYRIPDPEFAEVIDGWWPLENVRVGDRVGKLLDYGTVCKVVFGGYYTSPQIESVPATNLGKVDDLYNLRLRGDESRPERDQKMPKLQSRPATLRKATRIKAFTVEGWDTSGEWEAVDGASGAQVRKFTVRPDGSVRAFTLQAGSYDFRRID